jgi:hypothetical protein
LKFHGRAAEAERMSFVGLRTFRWSFVRTLAVSAITAAVVPVLTSCEGSPWEQGPSAQTVANDRDRAVARVFYANEASLGVWTDKRPSGSLIRHGMLVVRKPRLPSRNEPRGGRLEVTSLGPELQDKIDAIIADRIPIAAGMKTNFALGRTVPVRIERVDAEGERTLVAEGRVAFLELTR